MTKLVYFAWVRERIGKGEEELDLPAGVETAGDLIRHLKTLGEEYEIALAHENVIRVAVDQEQRGELDRLALLRLLTIEGHDGADLDLFLPATGAHNCVDHVIPVSSGSKTAPVTVDPFSRKISVLEGGLATHRTSCPIWPTWRAETARHAPRV